MKLTTEEIRAIALGAATIKEEEDGVNLYRFTDEQLAAYPSPHISMRGTAGIKLSFRTNSRRLAMDFTVTQTISRRYFAIELFINGELANAFKNYEGEKPRSLTEEFPLGDFSCEFSLGEGEKEVALHLPWNLITVIRSLTLDDGASLTPVRPKGKMLCLGDSITYGFDASRPSLRYTALLADHLGLEEVNKGIPGACFFPPLAKTPDAFVPKLITVVYGTNDFRLAQREEFVAATRDFFVSLCGAYPQTPIVAITPFWRKDLDAEYTCGPFSGIAETIRESTADLPTVAVLDGMAMIPHDLAYFDDKFVHPNNEGFALIFRAIKEHLDAHPLA